MEWKEPVKSDAPWFMNQIIAIKGSHGIGKTRWIEEHIEEPLAQYCSNHHLIQCRENTDFYLSTIKYRTIGWNECYVIHLNDFVRTCADWKRILKALSKLHFYVVLIETNHFALPEFVHMNWTIDFCVCKSVQNKDVERKENDRLSCYFQGKPLYSQTTPLQIHHTQEKFSTCHVYLPSVAIFQHYIRCHSSCCFLSIVPEEGHYAIKRPKDYVSTCISWIRTSSLVQIFTRDYLQHALLPELADIVLQYWLPDSCIDCSYCASKGCQECRREH